jgi:PPM family protein phosphatase
VTRALGVEPSVEVEVHEFDVLPDDVFLLCSDGLPDMVEDEDIHLTISTFNASLDVVGQQLVQLTNDHGGRDNVSVMLAQVLEPFAAKKSLIARLSSMFRS